MSKDKDVQDLIELLDELILSGGDELDEIEMLCGCTGKRCESGMITIT